MKPPFFKGRHDGLLKYLRRLCGNDADFVYPAVSGDQEPCDDPSLDPMASRIRRIGGLHLPHDPRLHIHGCQVHTTLFAYAPPRADEGSLAAAAAASGPAILTGGPTGQARPTSRWSGLGSVARAGTFRALPRYGCGSRSNGGSVGKPFSSGEARFRLGFGFNRGCGGFRRNRQRLFRVDLRRLLWRGLLPGLRGRGFGSRRPLVFARCRVRSGRWTAIPRPQPGEVHGQDGPAAPTGPAAAPAGRMVGEKTAKADKTDKDDGMQRQGQKPSQPCAATRTRGLPPRGHYGRNVSHGRYVSALEPAFLLGEQATAARKIRLDTRTMDAPAGTSSFQATNRPPSQETTPNRAAKKKRRPRR